MEVAAVHEVEDEAELVGGVEGVGHADNEGAVVAGAHEAEHDALVQRQGLALLHLDALLVQTLETKKYSFHVSKIFIALESPFLKINPPLPL